MESIDVTKFEKRALLFAVCPIALIVFVTLFIFMIARISGSEDVWAGYIIFIFIFFPIAIASYVIAVANGIKALKIRKSISAIVGVTIVAAQAAMLLMYYINSTLANY